MKTPEEYDKLGRSAFGVFMGFGFAWLLAALHTHWIVMALILWLQMISALVYAWKATGDT